VPVWLTISPKKMAEYRRVEDDVISYLADRAATLAVQSARRVWDILSGSEEQDAISLRKLAVANKINVDLVDTYLASQCAEAFIAKRESGADWETRMHAEAAEHLVTINGLRRAVVDAKIDAVHEWMDDFFADHDNAKLVTFGTNIDVVDGIYRRYQDQAVLVRGGVSAADRMVAQERFQTDPTVRHFVGNLAAAGEGLTLTAAWDVAMVQLDWTPAAHDQGVGRCYGRANDPHPATAHYLLAPGTVDEDGWDLLLDKRDANGKFIDGGSMKRTGSVLGDMLVRLAKRGMPAAA
jgi:hypothetical protein